MLLPPTNPEPRRPRKMLFMPPRMHPSIPPLSSKTIMLSPHVEESSLHPPPFGIGMPLQFQMPQPAPRRCPPPLNRSHGATTGLEILEGNASTAVAEILKGDGGVIYEEFLKEPFMIEHMRDYGPEGGNWHPSSDMGQKAEEKYNKMTRHNLLRKFRQWNPNFEKRFCFDWKSQSWSPKLGKIMELEHRRMAGKRPLPASKREKVPTSTFATLPSDNCMVHILRKYGPEHGPWDSTSPDPTSELQSRAHLVRNWNPNFSTRFMFCPQENDWRPMFGHYSEIVRRRSDPST